MKRIFSWLERKFSRPTAPIASDRPPDTVQVSAGIEMPDIYGEKIDAGERIDVTEPLLKILDPSSPDIDKSTGFNPYDTAVLREK